MYLKSQLQQLMTIHGRHTACISLYVPHARKVSETVAYLRNEINESGNIKDKSNRLDVTDNILRLID
jgi:peptide chain release factor subunit 1